ncbi:MAG: hypothetical protein H6Q74_1639 [Firmicutes bacterium]|nr:hypothetical protein [Bacillota bacterium]
MISEALFVQRFIKQPKKIGSIVPSSSFLTRKMLETLPWGNLETIVELGAGTGVFTDYIARNKREDCRVFLIEQDAKMCEALQGRFPEFYLGTQAERLSQLLYKYDIEKVDCIISGLPFAMFSKELQNQIMHEVTISLKSNGIFMAFQYSLHMKKTFSNCFSKVTIGFEPLNFPPAFVYCCRFPQKC